MEGTWKGERVLLFDLSYPAGKSISNTTVFMLRLAERRLPEFAAIRKDILLYTPTVDLPRVQTPPAVAAGVRELLADHIHDGALTLKSIVVRARRSQK